MAEHFDRDQITSNARQLRELAQRAIGTRDPDTFEALESRFNQFDRLLGQTLRTWSRLDAERIAEKLEKGSTLEPKELELLREIIAGDEAESVNLDEEVERRAQRLSELVSQIDEQVARLDPSIVPGLRSSVQDAVRLITHLRRFAAERSRLERFDHAVSDLSATARRVLAENLRGHLEHTVV